MVSVVETGQTIMSSSRDTWPHGNRVHLLEWPMKALPPIASPVSTSARSPHHPVIATLNTLHHIPAPSTRPSTATPVHGSTAACPSHKDRPSLQPVSSSHTLYRPVHRNWRPPSCTLVAESSRRILIERTRPLPNRSGSKSHLFTREVRHPEAARDLPPSARSRRRSSLGHYTY